MSAILKALITGATLCFFLTGAAFANQECRSQIKAMGDRAGLVTDMTSDELIVFSTKRKTIAPIHAFARSCLQKAYQKAVKLTKPGRDGKPMRGLGYASRDSSGIQWCEYPDLGPLGGYGSHATDWTIWIVCGRTRT